MNLQNKTIIDKQLFTEFQLFRAAYFKRFAAANIILYVLWLCISAVLIWLGIRQDSVVVILLGALSVLLLIRIFSDKCIKPRKKFEKNKLQETEVNYFFMKNTFTIPDDSKKEAPHIKYDQLMKVYETNHVYYLYLKKNICYLVAKNGFSEEDNQVFANRLKEQLGKKFIICK